MVMQYNAIQGVYEMARQGELGEHVWSKVGIRSRNPSLACQSGEKKGPIGWGVWGDFLSLSFQFYVVTILESIYATGEKKIQMYF